MSCNMTLIDVTKDEYYDKYISFKQIQLPFILPYIERNCIIELFLTNYCIPFYFLYNTIIINAGTFEL